jgi:hypothetical protein
MERSKLNYVTFHNCHNRSNANVFSDFLIIKEIFVVKYKHVIFKRCF